MASTRKTKLATGDIERALRSALQDGRDGLTVHQLAEECLQSKEWVTTYAPMCSEEVRTPMIYTDFLHHECKKETVTIFRLSRHVLVSEFRRLRVAVEEIER